MVKLDEAKAAYDIFSLVEFYRPGTDIDIGHADGLEHVGQRYFGGSNRIGVELSSGDSTGAGTVVFPAVTVNTWWK